MARQLPGPGPNKSSKRRQLRSALANKSAADAMLDALVESQEKWNATLDKLDTDAAGAIAYADAEAVLDLTADITLTDDTSGGASRNGNTFTLEVEAPAPNPTDTILADFSGDSDDIVCTITPNDGTNNGATPVDLTTAELAELINTGAVVGKTVTVTDLSSLRDHQTAAGGDATALADAGEGDGEVATFADGVDAVGPLDSDYEADGAILSMFEADEDKSGDQHKASMREVMQSALSHRRLANELMDSMEEFQVAYNALLVKLDAEAGTLDDGDYEDELALSPIDADGEGSEAQHKASLRRSLISALENEKLANDIMDAVLDMQESFNSALALIDAGTINGMMADLKVSVLSPDEE